ncbi:Major facilitator superfamily MFS_1 [Frankia sp. Hr75.2]|nr:Major facilitator superfamily MFS_1 [Frankia sp. Hr75.2]
MTNSPTRSPARSGGRLALIAFAQLIIALDYNIVYVALPEIGADLDFSAQSLQWVVSAYAVGFGGLLLFGGRAVDRLGARRIFLVAVAIYGVSSLAGGLATEPGLLVAARALQGIGGALLFPAILTLIYSGFAEGAERNRALAVWGAVGSGGLAAGSLLGGLFTDWWGWESVLFVNVPLALIALLAAPRLLPADAPVKRGVKAFDVPGALLATAGSSLIVFGLASGPESGWTSVRALGTIVIGGVLLVALLVTEARTPEGLLPLRLVRTRTLATTMAVAFLFMGTLATGYYVLTTYLQPVLGYSPTEAGLAFLPVCVFSMIGGPVTAVLLNRFGIRATLAGALMINGGGVALVCVVMAVDGSFWSMLPGMVLWGLGGGVGFTATFAAAGMGVAPMEQGVASAVASTSQQIGGAVGLAALIAVANHGLDYNAVPGPTLDEIVDGLRWAGVLAGALSVVGGFVALILKSGKAAAAAVREEPAGDEDEQVTASGTADEAIVTAQ